MKPQPLLLAVAILFAVCTCANLAIGQDDLNAVASGDWVNVDTWEGFMSLPTATNDAQISSNFVVTINPNDTADAFRVLLGDNANGDTGTINMTGGTLTTDRAMSLGGFEVPGNNGTGILNQSGGDIYIGGHNHPNGFEQLVLGDTGTSRGEYYLSGGTIDIPEGLSVGHTAEASGLMHQTGGQVTIGREDGPNFGYFNIGNSGTGAYTLDAGTVVMNTQPLFVGYAATGDGTVNQSGGSIETTNMLIGRLGLAQYSMTGGSITVAENVWIASRAAANGTYSLANDASVSITGNLNVCGAVDDAGGAPAGATGTLNLDGEAITFSVGGDLIATGATVLDPEEVWVNTSNFNFTTGATGDVSTIDVAGSADIDGAIFDIIESSPLANGTVLDLVETVGGVTNFANASVGPTAASQWTLQLGGAGGVILQAIKGTPILIPGDTNNDKIVNGADASAMADNWGATVDEGDHTKGDFNADGVVDMLDASILAANWGDHNEPAEATVPEPTGLALLLAMSMPWLMRRRRI